AMGRLKPEYRQALWLSYFEAMDREEIAAVLKKSVNNVDVLLYRARKALRTEWEKEGFDR
ncbi:MAG: sigma-70 region 4 domain-containing protein, partial [Clostridia bacterium]|nr:sigma-70 region 4 domain-containing protein [Clostridia bacterium]